LVTALALGLPVKQAFFSQKLHPLIAPLQPATHIPFHDIREADCRDLWDPKCLYIISGTLSFVERFLERAEYLCRFLVCFETEFCQFVSAKLDRQLEVYRRACKSYGIFHHSFKHADFGGGTSARHVIGFGGFVDPHCRLRDLEVPTLRWSLRHFWEPAAKCRCIPCDDPPALRAAVFSSCQ
jgi:hypothetical protein